MLTPEDIRTLPTEELAERIAKAMRATITFCVNTCSRTAAKGQLELEASLHMLAEAEGFMIDLSPPENEKHSRTIVPELCCSTCAACGSPVLSMGELKTYAGRLFCEDCAKNLLKEIEYDLELMLAEQRLREENSH